MGSGNRDGSMKAVIAASETASNGHTKTRPAKSTGPRMTRRLAEKRAVGDAKGTKFDGVALLRSLKK